MVISDSMGLRLMECAVEALMGHRDILLGRVGSKL